MKEALHKALEKKKHGKKHKHEYKDGECTHCGIKIDDEHYEGRPSKEKKEIEKEVRRDKKE